VSPLWPETIRVGLFPGHGWLTSKQLNISQVRDPSSPIVPEGATSLLKDLLDTAGAKIKRGSRVQILVSDILAATVSLPWQDALRRPVERQSYARVCLEKAGLISDDDWVIQAEYHQYCQAGLAYAVRQSWLEELVALLSSRNLKLEFLLPASVAAYAYAKPQAKEGNVLMVLWDDQCMSALCFTRGVLTAVDAEPVIGAHEAVVFRLLVRCSSHISTISKVKLWSTTPENTDGLKQMVSLALGHSSVQLLPLCALER